MHEIDIAGIARQRRPADAAGHVSVTVWVWEPEREDLEGDAERPGMKERVPIAPEIERPARDEVAVRVPDRARRRRLPACAVDMMFEREAADVGARGPEELSATPGSGHL